MTLDTTDGRGTLAPLPPVLSRGLAAVATCGFMSFVSSTLLFLYLTYKLVRWQLRPGPTQEIIDSEHEPAESPQQHTDKHTPQHTPHASISQADSHGRGNAFLVADAHLCPQGQPGEPGYELSVHHALSQKQHQDQNQDQDQHQHQHRDQRQSQPTARSIRARLFSHAPNQFLVLVYHLLLADIQQALAFLLNVQWLRENSIVVGSPICWAQGWFVSTGDLASSVFITAIAAHTYLAVVRGYRLPTWAFYVALAALWAFVYGLAVLGVLLTEHDDEGGLYVRAGAWCWVNGAYQDLRLYLHYLWIFVGLGTTTLLYALVVLHLRRSALTNSTASAAAREPAFLLYPLVYVVCTTPLAAGRIASMAGRDVSLAYFCIAGAMIGSAGWLDVVLYATTRRGLVFAAHAPAADADGLTTFAFMRTPAGRQYGNIVVVHGGGAAAESQTSLKALRRPGIQCDVVASVTVEPSGRDDGLRDQRERDRAMTDRSERADRYDDHDDASLNSRMGIVKSRGR